MDLPFAYPPSSVLLTLERERIRLTDELNTIAREFRDAQYDDFAYTNGRITRLTKWQIETRTALREVETSIAILNAQGTAQ
jgi:hypothetical protein